MNMSKGSNMAAKKDGNEKVAEKAFFSLQEEETLKFWKENKIFQKSVEQRSEAKKFIFFEGPPTANGKPGIHHVLARSYKDIICRYKTMKGFRVERKAGWDTHGLPVELQVEKELKISSKPEIEKYGIEEFNKKCKDSVWYYKDEWERLTERMAYWLDLEHPYITYSNEYIESVWWILAEINKKGLLYERHKVVPYCSRCGTGLSSHEVAQGYKKIKDTSVYVKFRAKAGQKIGNFTTDENTYFLVWTTTPWTLPGNVALAVGKDIEYILFQFFNSEKKAHEYLILAKNRYEENKGEHNTASLYRKIHPLASKNSTSEISMVVEEIKGKDLLGLEYEQLFNFVKPEHDKQAFKVVAGDFVTTQDGSGIVHIAPAFGVDDMNVAQENDLPVLMTVNPDGKFMDKITPWAGKYVVRDETNKEIISELDKRGILFKTEPVEHDYPFCWRCSTKLIYYAKRSWFIKMSDEKIKSALIKNNSQINWVPEYIKEGRMGEWLREVKDWALSRERYWGTPLPVWKCKKCNETKVVGSIDEIREPLGNLNKLFLVRHGEAESNVMNILSSDPKSDHYHLTEKGKEQIRNVANILKNEKIDAIFCSPFLRTKESAEIIAKELKLEIAIDDRLSEFGQGKFDGKKAEEFEASFPTWPEEDKDKRKEFSVETEDAARKRFSGFLDEINKKYKNKNIVVISHGDPLQFMCSIIQQSDRVKTYKSDCYPQKGSLRMYYSQKFDLHKPVIDKVIFKCAKCGGVMDRVKDVIDCWFDSGAMPFAQWHYPFENKEFIDKGEKFPADYISEAIDQTRGWFYTLLAISTVLNKGTPYKNVITYGHILDDKGQKMSKSKGNVVDPWLVADKYGIDMLRWYFYTIGAPGEPKRFDFKEMDEIRNKFFRAYWNSFVFYDTYKNIKIQKKDAGKPNILDSWIILRIDEVADLTAKYLENYDVMRAARLIAEFIDELSNKHIRFSRDRMRSGEASAIDTLREVLIKLTKLTAPFVPFISEEIYRKVKEPNEPESVHLAYWPEVRQYTETNNKIVDSFSGLSKNRKKVSIDIRFNDYVMVNIPRVFAIIDLGRTVRVLSKIPVRQALAAMEIQGAKFENKELEDLIRKELNVKKIVFKDKITDNKEFVSASNNNFAVALDTVLTDELREEGLVRELIRQIQDLRKNSKYTIKDLAEMYYNTDSDSIKKVFASHGEAIKKKTILASINFIPFIDKTDRNAFKEIKLDGEKIEIGLKLISHK